MTIYRYILKGSVNTLEVLETIAEIQLNPSPHTYDDLSQACFNHKYISRQLVLVRVACLSLSLLPCHTPIRGLWHSVANYLRTACELGL